MSGRRCALIACLLVVVGVACRSKPPETATPTPDVARPVAQPIDSGASMIAAAANAALISKVNEVRLAEMQYFNATGRYACQLTDLAGYDKHLAHDADYVLTFDSCNEAAYAITVRSVKNGQQKQATGSAGR